MKKKDQTKRDSKGRFVKKETSNVIADNNEPTIRLDWEFLWQKENAKMKYLEDQLEEAIRDVMNCQSEIKELHEQLQEVSELVPWYRKRKLNRILNGEQERYVVWIDYSSSRE